MENEVRRCPICGKQLLKRQKYFCSYECRAAGTLRGLDGKEIERRRKRMKSTTWEEVLNGMKETGMQYGEYVTKYCREDYE